VLGMATDKQSWGNRTKFHLKTLFVKSRTMGDLNILRLLANLNVLRVSREFVKDDIRTKTYRSDAFQKVINNVLKLHEESKDLNLDDLDHAAVAGDRIMLYIEMLDALDDDLPEVKRILKHDERLKVHYEKYYTLDKRAHWSYDPTHCASCTEFSFIKSDIKTYLVVVSGLIWWLCAQTLSLCWTCVGHFEHVLDMCSTCVVQPVYEFMKKEILTVHNEYHDKFI
jgi:hypothetical protein